MRFAPSCREISTISRSVISSSRIRRHGNEGSRAMNVLGISGSERAAAAAVSIDGSIVAAASEESFARVPQIGYRYTGGFPLAAIDACLTRAGLTLADIHTVSV